MVGQGWVALGFDGAAPVTVPIRESLKTRKGKRGELKCLLRQRTAWRRILRIGITVLLSTMAQGIVTTLTGTRPGPGRLSGVCVLTLRAGIHGCRACARCTRRIWSRFRPAVRLPVSGVIWFTGASP